MKKLVTFLCFYIPLISFSQSRELIDSINHVIAPTYILDVDSMPSYHKLNSINETDLTGDGVKEIIIAASNADSTTELNKIFVLRRTDHGLVIIDSSAAFDIGYLGPFVEIKGSYLTVIHTFDKGFCSLVYHFNQGINRYILQKLFYNITESNYPDYDHSVNLIEECDVETETLILKSYLNNYKNNSTDKKKTKIISEKFPRELSRMLTRMKDPYDYDVFPTDGAIYKQMMKY